jgi:hypothetical protein
MAAVFERIRAAVVQEATRPSPYDAQQHAKNQASFTKMVEDICKDAHFRPDMTAEDLWRHVWQKIRYAGFKAEYVNEEIRQLTPFFSDFRALNGAEWSFDPWKIAHGKAVREFLDKNGRFAGVRYSKLSPKLRKILTCAALFQSFPLGVRPLTALLGQDYADPSDEALWRTHKRLAELVGYTTALHVMMDIGFNCVKPDIWLVRLMCRLGWIENALPAASTDAFIKKNYQEPRVAVAVINCARKIAQAMDAWHPEAALREFDIVMVTYGQRVTHGQTNDGITRSLNEDLPVERITEWNPSSEIPKRRQHIESADELCTSCSATGLISALGSPDTDLQRCSTETSITQTVAHSVKSE